MSEQERITSMLVDTCSLEDVGYDFLGSYSKLRPSFFRALNDKGLRLLTHPILEKEIERHASDAKLYGKWEKLQRLLNESRTVLEHIGFLDDSLLRKQSFLMPL